MKKNLLLFLFLSISAFTFSQSYRPFPTNQAMWKEVWYGGGGFPYPHPTYTMNGDTTISGQNYKKIYFGSYYGALRESSKIIYFYPDTASQEYVLYDFNLTVGDTIFHPFGGAYCAPSPDTILVTGTSSMLTNDGYHRVLSLNSGVNWIEGIGSTDNTFQPNLCVSYNQVQLERMSHDSIVSYFMNIPPCMAYFSTAYDTATNSFNLMSYDLSGLSHYKWDFGDGTTSTLLNPVHVYAVDSIYTVCFSAHNGYGDSCMYCHDIGKDSAGNIIRNGGFTLMANSTAGIKPDGTRVFTFTAYPNPANGLVHFEFSEIMQNASVKVYDTTGELIKESTINNSNIQTLDFSDQSAGLYFVVITNKGATFRTKVVKY